jgi:hypothetical protein
MIKVSRASIVIIVSILVILLASAAFFHYFLSPRKRQPHPLIAIYPSAVPGHDPVIDNEQFLSDLVLVKELGFEGVRLHPADYDGYTCGKVADDLENLCLKFVMVIEFNVTNDQAQFDRDVTYFRNVAQQLVNKPNILWYAINYPYNWEKPFTQTKDHNFRIQLQTVIDVIHETDPNHKIFLISDSIDAVATPPTDFEHVDGFGIMPYSRNGWVDELDTERIDWIDSYLATGKEVYIAEWGVQTIEESPNPKYNHSFASDESKKVEIIKEFFDYIDDWDIYWTYFGLHDFSAEFSDWGIVYNNNTLKPSGETIKELLANKK